MAALVEPTTWLSADVSKLLHSLACGGETVAQLCQLFA